MPEQAQELLGLVNEGLKSLRDDEHFTRTFKAVVSYLSLADTDVHGALPVGRSTVTRWRLGTSRPRPMARKSVYRFLGRRLRARLNPKKANEPVVEQSQQDGLAV